MKEIVSRLHENRQIELAKSILESAGYEVSKKINESARVSSKKLSNDYEVQIWNLDGKFTVQALNSDGDPVENNRAIDELTFDKEFDSKEEAESVASQVANILFKNVVGAKSPRLKTY